MGFDAGIYLRQPDSGQIKGRQEIVACDCWFTSEGRTIPRLIKYQDREGVIHSVREIQVHSSQKRRYCGISVMEYACSCVEQGREYSFRLLFQLQDCLWKVIWEQ